MACNNCYSGCSEITSDRCVRYTGVSIPSLGIVTGDSLSDVEKSITDFLLSVIPGTAIKPEIESTIICTLVKQYLPTCGDITLVDYINALIKSACTLQTQVDALDLAVQKIEAKYTVGCLTGVTDVSGTHAILQAVITKLCSTSSGLTALTNELSAYYSKNGEELDNYIANYLLSHTTGSTLQSNKMVPYVAYEFYGSLSGKFDANGVGLANTDWVKVYICNGQNGTPDKRGRVAVGATDSPGPAITDPAVNPTIPGNPIYSAATPGSWTKYGANSIVLNASQVPNHSHAASAASTQAEHFHLLFNDQNAQTSRVTSVNYAEVELNAGTTTSYTIQGNVQVPSLGRSSGATPGITTNVTVAPTAGGGSSHPNTQPGIAAYYIMYIP